MPANFYLYERLLNFDIKQMRPGDGAAAEFLGAFCALYPLQSMKVLRLALAEELLASAELADSVRLVLLVRDPRKHRDWCPGLPDCDRAQRLCGYGGRIQKQNLYIHIS